MSGSHVNSLNVRAVEFVSVYFPIKCLDLVIINPLSAGDAFKRIHTVFPQLKFDRN